MSCPPSPRRRTISRLLTFGSFISLLANKLNSLEALLTPPQDVFKALSDPTRREIIKLLRVGPLTSGQIAEQFSSAWATISRHLGVLRDADVIKATRDGGNIVYELNTTVLQELVAQIFEWTNKENGDA